MISHWLDSQTSMAVSHSRRASLEYPLYTRVSSVEDLVVFFALTSVDGFIKNFGLVGTRAQKCFLA